jgi:hypothetical protein
LEVYWALGKALGIDVERALGRAISRERFARLAEAIWERPPAHLREAAVKAYQTEFGVALPEAQLTVVRDNAYYRPDL